MDCYGGYVVDDAREGMPKAMKPILHLAPNLGCPLLGLFGADDVFPTPAAVATLDAELTKLDKPHEFHSYDGRGPRLLFRRPARVPPRGRGGRLASHRRILRYPSERLGAASHVHISDRARRDRRQRQGPGGVVRRRPRDVYVDHAVHAPYTHTVNIDVINPQLGPSARVALELTEESALALADAIRKAIAPRAGRPGVQEPVGD